MSAYPLPVLLSAEEIYGLTGYRLAAYQVRWLQRQGITHWVRADGKPSVPRAAIEGRAVQPSAPEPDWSALARKG